MTDDPAGNAMLVDADWAAAFHALALVRSYTTTAALLAPAISRLLEAGHGERAGRLMAEFAAVQRVQGDLVDALRAAALRVRAPDGGAFPALGQGFNILILALDDGDAGLRSKLVGLISAGLPNNAEVLERMRDEAVRHWSEQLASAPGRPAGPAAAAAVDAVIKDPPSEPVAFIADHTLTAILALEGLLQAGAASFFTEAAPFHTEKTLALASISEQFETLLEELESRRNVDDPVVKALVADTGLDYAAKQLAAYFFYLREKERVGTSETNPLVVTPVLRESDACEIELVQYGTPSTFKQNYLCRSLCLMAQAMCETWEPPLHVRVDPSVHYIGTVFAPPGCDVSAIVEKHPLAQAGICKHGVGVMSAGDRAYRNGDVSRGVHAWLDKHDGHLVFATVERTTAEAAAKGEGVIFAAALPERSHGEEAMKTESQDIAKKLTAGLPMPRAKGFERNGPVVAGVVAPLSSDSTPATEAAVIEYASNRSCASIMGTLAQIPPFAIMRSKLDRALGQPASYPSRATMAGEEVYHAVSAAAERAEQGGQPWCTDDDALARFAPRVAEAFQTDAESPGEDGRPAAPPGFTVVPLHTLAIISPDKNRVRGFIHWRLHDAPDLRGALEAGLPIPDSVPVFAASVMGADTVKALQLCCRLFGEKFEWGQVESAERVLDRVHGQHDWLLRIVYYSHSVPDDNVLLSTLATPDGKEPESASFRLAPVVTLPFRVFAADQQKRNRDVFPPPPKATAAGLAARFTATGRG